MYKRQVLVPVDSNGIMPGVRKAEEAGIPVVCIGTPAAEETFLRTGVDYTETGRVIAKSVAEQLEGKGKVIILEGPPGAQNAIERLNGCLLYTSYRDLVPLTVSGKKAGLVWEKVDLNSLSS